ncbi:MAG: tripartite tricarboxylate transporter TctB family protein, partial [Faecousia sp.]
VWYLVMATQIRIMKMLAATWLNASSIPKLWGVLLLILGVILIVRGLGKMKGAKAAGYQPPKVSAKEAAKGFFGNNLAVVEMFVVLLAYIFLMQPVGFLIPTVVFLFLEFNILSRREERKYVLNAILAVVIGVAIYSLFKYGFNMPLPQGILKGIF